MRCIPLTQGKFTHVSDCDYTYLRRWKWYFLKARRGGYAARDIIVNGAYKTILMHRLICERAGIKLGKQQCDHKDQNGLNNCRSNLRSATHSQQRQNQSRQRNNQSGYKGVGRFKDTDLWRARIGINGKQKHLGIFLTARKAYNAYMKAARLYFGEFASI